MRMLPVQKTTALDVSEALTCNSFQDQSIRAGSLHLNSQVHDPTNVGHRYLSIHSETNDVYWPSYSNERSSSFCPPSPLPSKWFDESICSIGRLNSDRLDTSQSVKVQVSNNNGENIDTLKMGTKLSLDHKQKRPYTPVRDQHQYTLFQTAVTPCIQESSFHPMQNTQHTQEIPAGRYFDALKGPELEILRDSEELLLPIDKQWPFLLRFPIGSFGISLGLGSQTILWKLLATSLRLKFLPIFHLILWSVAAMALVIIFITYLLKCIFYPEAVRREYYHPVRINFFFAPWIACMFLTMGGPPVVVRTIRPEFWGLFMAPIFVLELKVYGQWFSGGDRRLSQVANPSTHLSVVGNFIGSLLAAQVGWKEAAIFFWAVGFAHYLILLVTLYQRLPTAEVLPKELHPVLFLFVAAPSSASVAWEHITGDFDYMARVVYFMGLFLYLSLVVRINLFRGFRFSVAWWAYTFPMTASAIATIHYSRKISSPITSGLAFLLSTISVITVFKVILLTTFHAFNRTLFPNDLAIAIRAERPKKCKTWSRLLQRSGTKKFKTVKQ